MNAVHHAIDRPQVVVVVVANLLRLLRNPHGERVMDFEDSGHHKSLSSRMSVEFLTSTHSKQALYRKSR